MALGLVTPAYAADRVFRDARNDAPARVDVRAVRVVHGTKALRVVVRLDDLRRRRDGSMDTVVVYVDSRRSRHGPEFYSSVDGFHSYFGRMRGWRGVPSRNPDNPFTGRCRAARADADLRRDRIVFVMPRTRRCVGKIRRARVNVLAAHRVGRSSRVVIDHAPARRRFSAAVRVG
jgi:hypothetical protein